LVIHSTIQYTPRVRIAVWSVVAAVSGVTSWALARRDSKQQRCRGSSFADIRFTSNRWSVVAACSMCIALIVISAMRNPNTTVAIHCVLAWSGCWLSLVDIDTHTVPRRSQMIVWSVAATFLVALSLANEPSSVLKAMFGSLAMWGVMKTLELLSRGDLGPADAVFAGYLGMFVGNQSVSLVPVALMAAFVLGGGVALVVMVVYRFTRGSHLPFAPFLFLGTMAAVLR